jgi:hypothetical protein
MQLTNPQLQQLWITNGGNPTAAPMAAAIAEAESSGNTTATNQNTNGSTDRGAWQINSVHGALSTYDPNANAKAAISISGNGTNWGPWTTYTSGAFRKFLSGAATAPVPGTATSTTPATTATAGGDLFGHPGSDFKYAMVWIAALITGAWLLYQGLDRSTHGTVSRTAGKVARVA